MATKTTTVLIDDIDGTEASKSITFSYEGTNYSIDLNDANAKSFSDALKPYVKVASIIGARRSTSGAPKSDKAELAAAREWLNENGHPVSSRGRIASELMDLYRASK